MDEALARFRGNARFKAPTARSLASAVTLRIGLLYGNPSATFTSEFLVDLLENSGRIGCQLVLEKCVAPRSWQAAAEKLASSVNEPADENCASFDATNG